MILHKPINTKIKVLYFACRNRSITIWYHPHLPCRKRYTRMNKPVSWHQAEFQSSGLHFRMRTHCRTVKQALSSLNSLWIYVKRVRSVYESKVKLEFIMPRPFSTPSFAQTCMSGQYTVSQEPGNKETRCKSSGAPVQNSKTGRIPGLLHGRLGVVDVVWQDALLGWQTHQGQPTPSCRYHKSEIPVRVKLYKSKASTLLPTILASLMVCVDVAMHQLSYTQHGEARAPTAQISMSMEKLCRGTFQPIRLSNEKSLVTIALLVFQAKSSCLGPFMM